MAKYSGSGWHFQSIRHSNARKYGKAGGKYAPEIKFKGRHTYKFMYSTSPPPQGGLLWYQNDKGQWLARKGKHYGQPDNKRQIFDYNKLSPKEKERFCEAYNIYSNDDLERVANKINYTEQLKKGIIEEQQEKHYGKTERKPIAIHFDSAFSGTEIVDVDVNGEWVKTRYFYPQKDKTIKGRVVKRKMNIDNEGVATFKIDKEKYSLNDFMKTGE